MGSAGLFIFMGVVVAFVVVVAGAFRSGRSVVVAIVSLLFAILAAGCGWYAFAESRSLPWTFGYGVVSLMSLCVSVKNLIGTADDPEA